MREEITGTPSRAKQEHDSSEESPIETTRCQNWQQSKQCQWREKDNNRKDREASPSIGWGS